MIINGLKKITGRGVIAISVALTLYSCGSGTTDPAKETTDSIPATETKADHKSQNSFYSVPSPIQLGQLLQKAGATYDKKVLNSLDNVTKYSTTNSKALNLGVYGADLSYSAIFNQTQETMSYLKGSEKIAEELGITGSFSTGVMKRMETNSGNKDSLLQIISELFLNSNEALKENDQSNISVLVLVGGYVEGLYVGTQVAKTVKNNDGISTRIAELKGSLNNLILMLGTDNNGDKEVTDILGELKDIKAIYDEMSVSGGASMVKSDTTKKTMTIGGKAKYTLTKDQLDKITSKVESIRAEIIKP